MKKYCLSDSKRTAARRALGVEDQIVLGHIGQMYYVKNHRYLLEVFAAFHKNTRTVYCFLLVMVRIVCLWNS